MKLTVFAATGGIGRQLLKQAIAGGHDVTAVVRNPGKLTQDVHTVIVAAMQATGIRCIVAVSAAPVGTVASRPPRTHPSTTKVTGSCCGI